LGGFGVEWYVSGWRVRGGKWLEGLMWVGWYGWLEVGRGERSGWRVRGGMDGK
jgi:hypothetical protein